jgi:DNA-binding CsgD family transcriptional regulator
MAPASALAYPLVLCFALGAAFGSDELDMALQSILTVPLVQGVLLLNVGFMINRAVQRIYFVGRYYGPAQGLLSVLRIPINNLINLFAVLRAWRLFLTHATTGKKLAWDKTAHVYPDALTLEQRWVEAAESWRQCGCPYEAALAQAGSGGPDDLREAIASLQSLGARPAALLLSSQLRQQGGQQIPRGPRPSTRRHPARLTARQDEVLRLLAEGLNNSDIAARLFISSKTVDNHVAAVFRKLGVANRRAAAVSATLPSSTSEAI